MYTVSLGRAANDRENESGVVGVIRVWSECNSRVVGLRGPRRAEQSSRPSVSNAAAPSVARIVRRVAER
jgi:hypothetical protein